MLPIPWLAPQHAQAPAQSQPQWIQQGCDVGNLCSRVSLAPKPRLGRSTSEFMIHYDNLLTALRSGC